MREYAASVGRSVLVSANLYDGAPWHDPLVAEVDVLVPEQRHTLYRQPTWTRYIAGFGGDKPVTISLNPYGGILPELVESMNEGGGYDRYRVMMYEAAALGVNMSVPYGAWMGSVIEDALYPPHRTTTRIQDFIADNERLYSTTTRNETALVYSAESNLHQVMFGGAIQSQIDQPTGRRRDDLPGAPAFFDVGDALVEASQPFDVVVFHDGRWRDDDASAKALERYRHVVLPDCSALTAQQVEAVLGYLAGGGTVTVAGSLGCPAGADVEAIIQHPGTNRTSVRDVDLPEGRTPQVVVDGPLDAAANLHVLEGGGTALHLVNYDYDTSLDRTVVAENVAVRVRAPGPVSAARVHAPGADSYDVPVAEDDGSYVLRLRALGCYAIVELVP